MPVARFWRESKRRYNLEGNECSVCGRKYFPPRLVCPNCHRASIGQMKDYKFSGRGKVISYTIVHSGLSENFKHQVPYIIAIIELKEGPRITAQLVDLDFEDLKIGLEVESIFRKIDEDGRSGMIYYGYKFRPIGK